MKTHHVILGAVLALTSSLLWGLHSLAAPFPTLTLDATPRTAYVNESITLTITVTNPMPTAIPLRLRVDLPPHVTYVPESARMHTSDGKIIPVSPIVDGAGLRWPEVPLPSGRRDNIRGINTFVQDHCDDAGLVAWQLDRARDLVGEGGVVKQLVMSIDLDTWATPRCWVDFVWGAYQRGLDPVLRLQGKRSGGVWLPPDPRGPYPYADIAARYRAFVAGLPRVDGRTLYIQVWNEPNRREEWGGRVDPAAYARFFSAVADAIHSLGDSRIRVLNAPLSPTGDYDNLAFIDAMFTAVPQALSKFDIWATHVYPGNRPPEYNHHHGTARPGDRHTIDAYVLEVDRLARWGRDNVQVLVSETGYALGDRTFREFPAINEENRADYMVRAFRDHWNRWPEIVAVAPFQLSDPDRRWSMWDWISPTGVPHLQYTRVAQLGPLDASGHLIVTLRVRVNEVREPTVAYVTARAEFSQPDTPPLTHTTSLLLLPLLSSPTPCTTCTPPAPTPTPTPTPPPPWPTPTPAPEAMATHRTIGGTPHGMDAHPITHALAVADYYGRGIRVMLPDTGETLSMMTWPGFWGIDKVTWSLSPPGIVATLQYAGAVIFAPEGAHYVRLLSVGEWPVDLALVPETGRAFVISARSRTLTVVNLSTWQVESTLGLEGTPTALAYDPTRGILMISTHEPHRILQVNARTLEIVHTTSLDRPPEDMAIDPRRGMMIVAQQNTRHLAILNLDGTPLDLLPLDCLPVKVAANASLGHFYVLCSPENEVQIWHTETRRLLKKFPTAGHTDMAVDAKLNRLYVSGATKGAITVVQDTPFLHASLGAHYRHFFPLVRKR